MKIVAFTDLDGTLLDAESYSWAPAAEAIEALKRRKASIVLASSKTLSEMAPLHQELGLEAPYVVENGGGVVFTSETSVAGPLRDMGPARSLDPEQKALLLSLGERYEELVRALEDMAGELGVELRGFASMSQQEVRSLTGLDPDSALRARARMFDEPFLVEGDSRSLAGRIHAAARARGLVAVQGGRFWHLIGHEGKGKAVSMIADAFRQAHGEVIALGLGDSPNDYPLLEAVDIPILVGGMAAASSLPESLAGARMTAFPGPKGWNEAILGLLPELTARFG